MTVTSTDCTDFRSGTRSSYFVISYHSEPRCIRNIRAHRVFCLAFPLLLVSHELWRFKTPITECQVEALHQHVQPVSERYFVKASVQSTNVLKLWMIISCFRVFSCGQSIRISRCFTEPTPLRVAIDWAADESAHHGWRLLRSSQHRIPHERFPALLFNMAQSSHSAKPKPIVLCIELRLWTKCSVEVQSTTRAAVCERASSHIRCQCGSESPLVLFSNRTSTPYADYSRNIEQLS